MINNITTVSITGADDTVDPEVLCEISEQYPFVEWAILYNPEKFGTPRNPSVDWCQAFLNTVIPFEHTALHVCGENTFLSLLAGNDAALDYFEMFGRVQLNINARGPVFTDTEVHKIYDLFHYNEITTILQYNDGTADTINAYLQRHPTFDANILFDASTGLGKSPDGWPSPIPGLKCGYAGGLGPENIFEQLPRIITASRERGIWIDMESGVRTNNVFDVSKVKQVLEAVAPRILQTS